MADLTGPQLARALMRPGTLNLEEAIQVYQSEMKTQMSKEELASFGRRTMKAARDAGLDGASLVQDYIKTVGDKEMAGLLDEASAKVFYANERTEPTFKFGELVPEEQKPATPKPATTKGAKSQEQVLKNIVKSLGYESPVDMPSRADLEAKLVQGTLSVREAATLDLYARGIKLQPATAKTEIGMLFAESMAPEKSVFGASNAPSPSAAYTRINTVISSTTKAGFKPDDAFRDVGNNREALEKIAAVSKSAIDPNWSGVFQSLQKTQAVRAPQETFQYMNPKDVGSGLAGSMQSRGTDKFAGVPPAKQAFPEIVAGLSTVDDPNVRNALVTSALAPYRPGEIANLRLGKYDMAEITVDRPPGYFDPEKGAIIFPEGRTGNKAASNLVLDKNSILYNTLMLQASQARLLGSDQLFPNVTTGAMTGAIKENITPRMAQFEEILGRPFNQSKDFRKLVASMIVGELGYAEEAEKLLGHTNDTQINDALTKVGQKHYISTIVRTDNPLGAVQLSLENMIGEAIGAQTLNETAASMGLEITGFTDSDARPVTITRSGEELSAKATVADRLMTADELASLDSRREEATARSQQAAAEARMRAAELEQQTLATQAETARMQLENEDILRENERAKAQLAEVKREERAKVREEKKAAQAEAEKPRVSEESGEKIKGVFGKFMRGIGKSLPFAGSFAVGMGAYEDVRAEGGSELAATAIGIGAGAADVVAGTAAAIVDSPDVGQGSDIVPPTTSTFMGEGPFTGKRIYREEGVPQRSATDYAPLNPEPVQERKSLNAEYAELFGAPQQGE